MQTGTTWTTLRLNTTREKNRKDKKTNKKNKIFSKKVVIKRLTKAEILKKTDNTRTEISSTETHKVSK